jgi:hypothetical protein
MKRTERGWPGHLCVAERCLFRRNTLLEHKDIKIVISTVGLYKTENGFETIGGIERYYETMVFYANDDKRYYDADVSREICFNSNWYINKIDADDKANEMHENVICEIIDKLEKGIIK